MTKLFFILCLSFASMAQARLAGDWIGWGNWTFKGEPPGTDCPTMQMKWSESADRVSVDGGLFDCGVVAMHLGETAWKISNGHLFDETGKNVGTYDGANLSVYMPSPNEKTTIQIIVKREANHIDYQEVWFNQFEKVYVITGRLFTSGE